MWEQYDHELRISLEASFSFANSTFPCIAIYTAHVICIYDFLLYKEASHLRNNTPDRQHHQSKQPPNERNNRNSEPHSKSRLNNPKPTEPSSPSIKHESPRPRPRRPLPHHHHPLHHRLLGRHDLLHPRLRPQLLLLRHRRPARRTHRRHLPPQNEQRPQPQLQPPLRHLHQHLQPVQPADVPERQDCRHMHGVRRGEYRCECGVVRGVGV